MGIRKKIFFGLVIIGFILFLSGIISIFQLIGMEKSVSGMLSDNVKSVELSKYMTDAVEAQSWNILNIITKEKTEDDAKLHFYEDEFKNLIDNARNNLTVEGENVVIDSLEAAYIKYHQRIKVLDSLFALPDTDKRINWFADLYQPAYVMFNTAIQKLRLVNQNALFENSVKLEEGFYRMLMPPIIAIGVGLLLVILFNYFLNLYFISPILRINKGIKSFLDNKIPYNVTVDTSDEINELNEDIKMLISQSKRDNPATNSTITGFNNKF